ncbi:carotenoid oxygenase family protein [Eilatimonas milleporae]|uniref:Dioxygenase n=1 Tax=Eilatimonas milleporae TaxID=911205 RepID=A0A3M0CDW7_9PROT|nr:carotenoid oxygenase family protein [Eilatimonas milleporae]RMB04936.1 carotenoid cleavage dioxygenase-like enzyme [Eilatimonas milleporae]
MTTVSKNIGYSGPHMTRRALLTGLIAAAGAGLSLQRVHAFAGQEYDWHLGFRNAPPSVDPVRLSRLHGYVPVGLKGVLYRNGPAQFTRGGDTIGHWFDGDGMIRAFRIADNEATLAAQFVATRKRSIDAAAGSFAVPGFGTAGHHGAPVANADDVNAANTSLLDVEGQLWALWEAGSPYAVDPVTLATKGPVTLRQDLRFMPFSAHPKIEPGGRIWNFGLGFGGAAAFIWSLSPGCRVEKAVSILLPRRAYLHDWAVTRTKLILPLQPWISTTRLSPFAASLEWRPQEGMQVLVIDKDDFSSQCIYDLPAAAFLHTGGAWEEKDGSIRFDVCLANRPTLDAETGARIVRGQPYERTIPRLAMAVLKPDGKADITRCTHAAEFPKTDPRRQGEERRSVWSVTIAGDENSRSVGFDAVARTDWDTGHVDRHVFGNHQMVEEFIFVPRQGEDGETDGWLIGTTLNLKAQATELHILDTGDLDKGPLVSWRAPLALPLGFHGVWRGGA